ncbi:MAG: hydantoinase B/oxoprolinase family protein [Burkholderiales bacterium]|nr:hydantoinase B/oxoprolinase family protein [Burkholderiales bacterium]
MSMPRALEMEAPIRPDPQAAHRHRRRGRGLRSGVGIVREYKVLRPGQVLPSRRGAISLKPAACSATGPATAPGRNPPQGRPRRGNPLQDHHPAQKGDRVLIKTPGSGSYGDPKQRDRSAVRRDIENGKISEQTAREIYGLDRY